MKSLKESAFSHPVEMNLSVENSTPLFSHPVGMRLSALKEASLRDADSFSCAFHGGLERCQICEICG